MLVYRSINSLSTPQFFRRCGSFLGGNPELHLKNLCQSMWIFAPDSAAQRFLPFEGFELGFVSCFGQNDLCQSPR